MKKILAIITVVMMCASLMVPAMAADFMPSVTNKPAPEVVVARIIDENGNVIKEVKPECLIITPVSEVDTSTEIPEDARATLKEVYGKLTEGSMSIPYAKHNPNLDPSKMVIRDLFDATFVCNDGCVALLEPEGVVLEIVFDLNVAAGVDVYSMTYKNNEWNPIVSTVNNGDGTVTATFEKLCPVEFSINTGSKPPVGTGDQGNTGLWGILAIGSLAAIVVLTVIYRVGSKKHA